MFSRRDFMTQGLLPIFAGSAVPAVFANGVAAAAADSPKATPSDRVLVLVQLAGGNDGLNTLIPFQDGAYHDARPTLRQDQGVLTLNGQLGLHPNLKGLKASWDAGQLAVVQGVGYPNPNLSHFASMSVWETASVKGGIGDGWLGRYLNYLDQVGESPNHALEGVSAGSMVPPELRSKAPVTALQSLQTFRLQPVNEHGTQVDVENPMMKFYGAFKSAGPAPFGALLDTTLQDALQASHALRATDESYVAKATYPANSPIASSLKLVAETIVSGLGVRVAHVTLGGFDNHAREKPVHDKLLLDLDQALAAFMQDLAGHGYGDKVLVMTWSEFGRRVKENGSAGTDHGTAAPMFLLGAPVKGGLYGQQPSLTGLDNGNLKFTTDFRSVYASVLQGYLNAPASDALRKHDVHPSDIRWIINSHLHFDHCGQNAVFPQAPLYVQRAEYERRNDPNYTVVEWLNYAGARWELLDGEREIVPGVRAVTTPGHTPGHQGIQIQTTAGPALTTGDACWTVEMFDGEAPRQGMMEDIPTFNQSLEKIRLLEPAAIHFCHANRTC